MCGNNNDNELDMNYIIQSSTAIKSGPFFFLLLGWHSPSKSSKFTRTAQDHLLEIQASIT